MIKLLLECCLWLYCQYFKEINVIKSTLLPFNTYLSHSQKELLLWHQWLSYASISWVQLIMRERTFLPCIGNEIALHSGPLIKLKSLAPHYDTSKLKCTACLYAKASIRSPSNQPPCHSVKYKTLKTNHLKPGNWSWPITISPQFKVAFPIALERNNKVTHAGVKKIQLSTIFKQCKRDHKECYQTGSNGMRRRGLRLIVTTPTKWFLLQMNSKITAIVTRWNTSAVVWVQSTKWYCCARHKNRPTMGMR